MPLTRQVLPPREAPTDPDPDPAGTVPTWVIILIVAALNVFVMLRGLP